MNQRQITLVQQGFDRASRLGAHVAATFYAELFAIDPALRPMFKGDMIAQGEKLMRTLAMVVEGLAQPETVRARCAAAAAHRWGRAGRC